MLINDELVARQLDRSACRPFEWMIILGVLLSAGWPTFGAPGADVDKAHSYNNNLIRHVRSGTGTPRVPGTRIEAFIFEAFDEPNAPPTTEPTIHPQPFFGINYEVGVPKYTLDWRQAV